MALSADKVVFMGLPSSGKTVLFSVLALKYPGRLIPKNKAAMDFCEEADRLNQQQWPAPTNPLQQKTVLDWDLKCSDKTFPVVACDVAGEEWNRFVLENQDRLPSMEKEPQKPPTQASENSVKTILDGASVICLLLDLGYDINHENSKNWDQIKFIGATLNYLEKIGRKNCPIALVLTKCKTYGVDSERWMKVLQERYIALFKRQWHTPPQVIATDAVADTVTDSDGTLLPANGFSTFGLNQLLMWIEDNVRTINRTKICLMFLVGTFIVFICFAIFLFVNLFALYWIIIFYYK